MMEKMYLNVELKIAQRMQMMMVGVTTKIIVLVDGMIVLVFVVEVLVKSIIVIVL